MKAGRSYFRAIDSLDLRDETADWTMQAPPPASMVLDPAQVGESG